MLLFPPPILCYSLFILGSSCVVMLYCWSLSSISDCTPTKCRCILLPSYLPSYILTTIFIFTSSFSFWLWSSILHRAGSIHRLTRYHGIRFYQFISHLQSIYILPSPLPYNHYVYQYTDAKQFIKQSPFVITYPYVEIPFYGFLDLLHESIDIFGSLHSP